MGNRTSLTGAQGSRLLQLLAVMSVILIVPLFFVGGPDWSSTPLDRALWDLGHLIFFGLATFAVQPWRWLRGWRLWLVATVVVLAIGIGIELLQAGLNRQEDWRDVMRNQIGTWLVLAWHPVLTAAGKPPRPALALALASLVLLVFELGTAGVVAARQFEIHRQLPQLYDFTHEEPNRYWRGPVEPSTAYRSDDPQAAENSLKISLNTRLYSGASLDNLPPDWRGYETLRLSLFNPHQDSVTMTLRINDVAHERNVNTYSDRFNTQLVLEPGENRFTVSLEDVRNAPDNRSMDLSDIRRLGIFVIQLPQPRTVYLTELRLE